MLKQRLVACLILRDGLIVQSFGFRRYLPIGRPKTAIEFVSKWDVDEIVVLDITASPQGRAPDSEVIALASERCFVPVTVGGGIRCVSDIQHVIRSGADKVALNSWAWERPQLITEAADAFGSQCVVLSIDASRAVDGSYEVLTRSGSHHTGRAPQDWAQEAECLGAGEILINSIDRDGSKAGYDIDLIRAVCDAVSIPVIALGGVGRYKDFASGILEGGASAVAAGNIFHFIEHSTIVAKAHLVRSGIDVRLDSVAKYERSEFDDSGRLLNMPQEELDQIFFQRFSKREG